MRMTTCRSSWAVALAVGALLAPAALAGQEPAARPADARSHTVRPGDTLWDLARTYLADPFLWPEIYRVNTEIVEDPHWIFPGEVLTIPGDGAATAAKPLVADAAGEEQRRLQEQPGGGAAPGGDDAGGSRYPRTVFSEGVARTRNVTMRQGVMGRNARPEVRSGEYLSAPFGDRSGGPRGRGRVLARASIPGSSMDVGRERVVVGDEVYVQIAGSTLPLVGDRYVSFRLDSDLDNGGQVVVPTGVVRIERATPGEAALARVVQEFDDMRLEQNLYPYDTLSMALDLRPAPVERGAMTKVTWVENDPELPTIQHRVLLEPMRNQTVRPGDQFALVRERVRHTSGAMLPEREIAIVQVLKVTRYAISGIIIDQTEPKIHVGTAARLVARMP